MIRSSFLITVLFFLCKNPLNAKSLKDSTNTIKKVINIGVPSAAIISLVGINEVWYKNYARSDFHFFDDLKEWNGMDKSGVRGNGKPNWEFVGLKNYITLFTDDDEFYVSLFNNIRWLVFSLLAVPIGLALALFVNQRILGIRYIKSLF